VFAQVVGAWTTWLESWNGVFAGSTSESDGTAHSFVSVIVDAQGAAHAKALIPVILVSTVASSRVGDWLLWHDVTVEFLFTLHSVDVDRVEAAVRLESRQRWRLIYIAYILLLPSADVVELAVTGVDGRVLRWQVVVHVDILLVVYVVAGSLRFGGDAGGGVLVVAIARVETHGWLVVGSLVVVGNLLEHLSLGLVGIDVSALWVHGWLGPVTLSGLLNGLAAWLSFSMIIADLSFDLLVDAGIIKAHLRSNFLHKLLGSVDDLVDLVDLSLESAEGFDGLVVSAILLNGWQVAEHSRGTNSSLSL